MLPPSSRLLLLLLPTTLTLAKVPIHPPSYFLKSCPTAACPADPPTIDANMNGDNKCHPLSSNITTLLVESHNFCVNLYSEPDCKGPRLVAQSDSGACSLTNVAGKTFGGEGSDVPDWLPKSFVANGGGDGNDPGSEVPGMQLVPVAKVATAACNSCCGDNDGFGARRLRRG